MKTVSFFAIAALVICLSCNKDNMKDNTNKNSGNLRLELVSETNVSEQPTTSAEADKIIAVLDIKSYNAKTGEIIFNNKLPEDIVNGWKDDGYKVNVYKDTDTPLFTLIFSTSLFSYLYNEPVLYYSLLDSSDAEGIHTEKDKWYILSGYPYGEVLSSETITDTEQLKNFKKIEAKWNIFIDELKKYRKYIN